MPERLFMYSLQNPVSFLLTGQGLGQQRVLSRSELRRLVLENGPIGFYVSGFAFHEAFRAQ